MIKNLRRNVRPRMKLSDLMRMRERKKSLVAARPRGAIIACHSPMASLPAKGCDLTLRPMEVSSLDVLRVKRQGPVHLGNRTSNHLAAQISDLEIHRPTVRAQTK